jgi:hypothetical protein
MAVKIVQQYLWLPTEVTVVPSQDVCDGQSGTGSSILRFPACHSCPHSSDTTSQLCNWPHSLCSTLVLIGHLDRLRPRTNIPLSEFNLSVPRSNLGAFAKLRNSTISFVISVRADGTTRLPLNWFSWILIFDYLSKICRENSSIIKIWQE